MNASPDMSETLKPCPFGCVGGHVLNKRQEVPWIECEVCGARGPYGNDVDGAKARWNTRAESAELSRLRAEVEALKKDLRRAEERDSGGYAPDGKTWKRAVMDEAAKRAEAEARALATEQALAGAREALEPFKNVANGYDDELDDDTRPVGPFPLKLCRRAREAWRALRSEPQGGCGADATEGSPR